MINLMTPLDYYNDACQKKIISKDDNQLIVLTYFQQLHQELAKRTKRNFWDILKKSAPIKGIYLWGGVGIGKTFLMDCFYNTLPVSQKWRTHFHKFMQWVHSELRLYQGKKNPLEWIANDICKRAKVLCFDELIVTDITDAMLLSKLFDYLFKKDIVLVATSNTEPDELYKYGLQREQFLPAIELIKRYTQVVFLPTQLDYRLRHLKNAGVFFTPLTSENEIRIAQLFDLLAAEDLIRTKPISLFGREIKIVKATATIIWFEFNELCRVPRSQQDYLQLANQYQVLFLSNIPKMAEEDKDSISLFINLIDVLYDSNVKLIFSAAEPIEEIYAKGRLTNAYLRTRSRLIEMQSEEYFMQKDS